MTNNILTIENLKIFATSKEVTFNVNSGDICCIYGLNGCGKTTLLKIICNIEKQFSGNVNLNIDKSKIGICLQFPEHLIFKEKVIDEAIIITKNEEKAKILLKELNINENISPFTLSDGEKRLLFIIGLLKSNDFLIFDEPFASLDKEYKNLVKEKIIEKSKEGKTILYTSNRKNDIINNSKVIHLN